MAHTVDFGQLLRGIAEGVGDQGEGGTRVGCDGLGVDVADAAGPMMAILSIFALGSSGGCNGPW